MDLDNMTVKDVEKILNRAPPESREALAQLFRKQMSVQTIKELKKWLIDDFDEDSPTETLLALTAAKFIFAAGYQIQEEMKVSKASGSNYYSGKRASQVIKATLQQIIDSITSVESCNEDNECQNNH